ncbi:M24 family metallopeptidase [Musicola keenii]|uniref:M24 family metallopeptidase n=1 Tax=Musicola keenii TaxID=2884250 RepID=UPI00177CEE50|nr:Xaa-Pro peptidase family protein [Musicola keenii]
MTVHASLALARTRAAMQQADVELLLVDHGELLAWLTGYTVSETCYRACLVPLEGEPWMVLRQLDEAPCRALSSLNDIVVYDDHQDPFQAVADSLLARGFGHARLGVDFNSYGMTVYNWRQLCQRLPAVQWQAMDGLSDRLRSVKFADELAALRQAARIADDAMRAIADEVTTGWRVRDVAALAAHTFLRNGADTGETGPIVCANGDNGFLHASSHDHRLSAGDMLHVELIPKVNHYSARLMRPFLIGTPSAEQQQIATQLTRFQDAQIAAMKPGVNASDVDALLRQAVLDAGLREHYGNVTGYALGLYTRTPRPSDFSCSFTPAADWLLEENMVFHMYASARSLAFSESVVVTPQGGQRLSALPRALLSL